MLTLACRFAASQDQPAWPDPFAPSIVTADGPVADIQGHRARLVTGSSSSYGSAIGARIVIPCPDQFEIYTRLELTSGAEVYPALTWRGTNQHSGSNSWPTSAYGIELQKSGGNATWILRRRQDDANTPLATGGTLGAWAAGLAVCIRVRVTGSLIRARVWADGSPEPTTWVRAADAVLPAKGWIGVSLGGGNTAGVAVQWSDITVAPCLDTAPLVTGSRGGNAAVASALDALADLGLIADGTTA